MVYMSEAQRRLINWPPKDAKGWDGRGATWCVAAWPASDENPLTLGNQKIAVTIGMLKLGTLLDPKTMHWIEYDDGSMATGTSTETYDFPDGVVLQHGNISPLQEELFPDERDQEADTLIQMSSVGLVGAVLLGSVPDQFVWPSLADRPFMHKDDDVFFTVRYSDLTKEATDLLQALDQVLGFQHRIVTFVEDVE